ncbi:hypothetical protein Agub_g11895 [Astrephomene gubernaculifera]|uniref:Uncharacterized protein n=1 Tax=Astrephomene gubernaculifera TaxID=47775 RepID=A0AAD3DXK8_9CHLO|nr:hypothetical protein Agub_g11895 [Astrephomene gubernaculifera]
MGNEVSLSLTDIRGGATAVEARLRAGASPNKRMLFSQDVGPLPKACKSTPLGYALLANDLALLDVLLAGGADVQKPVGLPQAFDFSPLHLAVALDRVDAVRKLLACSADPNAPLQLKKGTARPPEPAAPAAAAAGAGTSGAERPKLLPVSLPYTRAGDTPLHIAIDCSTCSSSTSGGTGVVEALLQHEATNVNAPNARKRTPLYKACKRKNAACVRLLTRHPRIDVNAGGPLFAAIRVEDPTLVSLLLRAGAGVHQRMRNEAGETPLHFALHRSSLFFSNRAEIVGQLVRAGAVVEPGMREYLQGRNWRRVLAALDAGTSNSGSGDDDGGSAGGSSGGATGNTVGGFGSTGMSRIAAAGRPHVVRGTSGPSMGPSVAATATAVATPAASAATRPPAADPLWLTAHPPSSTATTPHTVNNRSSGSSTGNLGSATQAATHAGGEYPLAGSSIAQTLREECQRNPLLTLFMPVLLPIIIFAELGAAIGKALSALAEALALLIRVAMVVLAVAAVVVVAILTLVAKAGTRVLRRQRTRQHAGAVQSQYQSNTRITSSSSSRYMGVKSHLTAAATAGDYLTTNNNTSSVPTTTTTSLPPSSSFADSASPSSPSLPTPSSLLTRAWGELRRNLTPLRGCRAFIITAGAFFTALFLAFFLIDLGVSLLLAILPQTHPVRTALAACSRRRRRRGQAEAGGGLCREAWWCLPVALALSWVTDMSYFALTVMLTTAFTAQVVGEIWVEVRQRMLEEGNAVGGRRSADWGEAGREWGDSRQLRQGASAAEKSAAAAGGSDCGGGDHGLCCVCKAASAVVGFVHSDVVHCCMCGECEVQMRQRGLLGSCPVCGRPAGSVTRVVVS